MKRALLLALLSVFTFAFGCSKAPSNTSGGTSENKPTSTAKSFATFEFYYRLPNVGVYEVKVTDQGEDVLFSFKSEHQSYVLAEKIVDGSVITDISTLLEKYDIYSWNGFDSKSEKEVLERETFSVFINFGGENLYADGNDSFPEKFHEFYQELHELTLSVAKNEQVPLMEGVDYSLYRALIDSKVKEYGELSTTPTHSYEDTELHEVYGLAYTELLDLDSDGVLELIVVATNSGELTNEGRHSYSGEHAEIYTITEQNELRLVGKLPLLLVRSDHLSAGAVYCFNYSFVEGNGYIGTGFELGDTNKIYYRYTPTELQHEVTLGALLISGFGTAFNIGERSVEIEEFKAAYKSYEVCATTRAISGLLLDEVDELRELNLKAEEFLSNYDVKP